MKIGQTHTLQQRNFGLVIASLFFLAGLVVVSRSNYLLFHALVEISSVVIGSGIFVLAWHGRRYLDHQFFLVMGIALLCTSGLDLLHTLAYKGMGVFPGYDADLPTQLWIAARYLHSGSLVCAALVIQRKVKVSLIVGSYTAVTALLVWAIFTPGIFPVCFVEGQGLTPFKKLSELVICGIFALALILLSRQREQFSRQVYNVLQYSILFAIAAECAFVFYVNVYGISNLVGHIFKLASFACLYLGVIRTGLEDPLDVMFQELQQKDQQLEQMVAERTDELTRTIQQLHQEVTSHRQTEQTLLDVSLFLKESQSIARLGGWKSNPRSDMLFWTDEMYRILEHPEGEPLSHEACFRYFDQQDLPMVKQALLEALQNGTPFRLNCYMITTSGRRFWVDFRCVGRLEGPDGSYIAGTIQDITEHKQIEELLISAKEMAEATNRTKNELLAALSHELRTPLNGVMGGAQLLEMTELSAEQDEYLQMVKISAINELALVNDLLDLAGLEATCVKIEAQPFILRQSIALSVAFHRSALEERGLSFTSDLSDSLNQVVSGDSQRLTQIVNNLLSNAIKFTLQGDVTLAAKTSMEEDGKLLLQLRVSDTGIGIAPQDLDRIFQPFVQADMSNTRKFGGTGLGLAICSRLVERMGGSIQVESQPGVGSCFTLLLPLTPVEDPDETLHQGLLPALPVWQGAPLSVLIAEDNDTNLKAAAGLVRKLGHRVLCAEDGKQALAHWMTGTVDAILMDIQMPVMDGREAARFIRQREQDGDRRTPIIALTAHAMAGDREQLLAEGFDGYVAKPFQLHEIAELLLKVRQQEAV